MESHQIDYNHPVVKTFLDNINNTLQCASTSGTDAKTYDTIWLQMGNKDLATVFLTVLMGKLLLTEQRAIQYRQKRREMEPSTINDGGDVSSSNNTNDDFNELNNNNNNNTNNNNNNNNSGNGLGAIANSANNNSGLNLNASNNNNNDQDDFSVQEVVDLLQLGTHKFDPQHPLLIKRKESIKKRRARSLVIQTEETLSKEDVERAVSANQEAMLGSGGDDSSDGPNVVSYGDFSATRDDSIDERINFHFNTSLQNDRGLFSEKQFRERTAIMNSILYVSLFYRFDHLNPSLLDVMDKWRQTRTQQVQQNTQIVSDNVSDEMRDVLCPPIEALYKYLQLCADYDVVSDMDVTLRPQLSTSDPLATIGSYVYTRLQTICRIPRYTENVLGDLIILLRSCSTNQAYLSDHYDPIALKNSLNLTKLILSQLYIERESPKLAELSGVLKAYFLEPLPIGAMVHDVLRMCQQLQKDPGCLMRERFERSIRQCKDPKNGIDKIDRPRKVYVFYNPLSKKAHHLLDRIDIYPDGTAHFDIVATKANLVLNVFSQSGNNDLVAASHELYQKVLPETLAQQYAKATKNSLNPAELKFLKDELLKHPAQTTPPTYKRCESPKMPEAEFEYIALPEERNLAELEREAKIFPRCGFYSKLLDVLDRARSESGLPSDSDETLMVDVAIAGGSGTLQYFVHSLFLANRLKVLTDKRPQIDFKVFLIPLGENNYLSNWLEKYDGWFSRHVHQPMQSSLPLLPYLRTSNANRAIIARSNMKLARESTIKRSNTVIMTSGKRYAPLDAAIITQYKPPKKFLTPHRFMESMLSDFVTDASTSYPVHIYNAQFLCNEVVTITDPSGGNKTSQQKSRKVKEYISLSFCQRIDIGIVADAYQFAKDERIEGTPLEELLCHRNFRYQAPPLSVSYVPMDPTGEINRSSEINEQSKVYQNISIISCSSFGDRGSLVSPSQPWLEVFAENITTKKKSKLRDCDLGTNYHVGSISIESTTHQQFSVLLDGELYGPFHKMIINASTQTFNLQTFSNIDVY